MAVLRFLFYAAMTFLSCKPPPEPKISMQCAVNALIHSGFDVPPYKGVIESDCDKAVKQYVDSFYPELKSFLECGKQTKGEITCVSDVFKAGHYENFIMVEFVGVDLLHDKKLDSGWLDSLKKVSYKIDAMDQIADVKCKPEDLIDFRAGLRTPRFEDS